MRSIWKGDLSFGLVNVPVKVYSATESHDRSSHQVDAKDGTRVRYRRVREGTDVEVDYSQIANAYGNQWPMPTQSGKGWPVGTYGNSKAPFNYKWQGSVKNLNVTFQGPPLSALTDVP